MNTYFLSLLEPCNKRRQRETDKISQASNETNYVMLQFLAAIRPLSFMIGFNVNNRNLVIFHTMSGSKMITFMNKNGDFFTITKDDLFSVTSNSDLGKVHKIEEVNIVSFLQSLNMTNKNFIIRSTLFFFLREENEKKKDCSIM